MYVIMLTDYGKYVNTCMYVIMLTNYGKYVNTCMYVIMFDRLWLICKHMYVCDHV